MKCDGQPFRRMEDIKEPAVVASYVVNGSDYESIMKRAAAFAIGQTIGTWVSVPGISEKMIYHYQGKVLSVLDAGEKEDGECHTFILRIAFPTANLGNSITMLMTALVGNDVSTAIRARLVDLDFINGAQKGYCGPRQGIRQLRKLTGVQSRPLVLNMIKPCAGFTPEEGAGLFAEPAMGGVDLIKDDELLGSPGYNHILERFSFYEKAAKAVYEKTGHRPVYLPNISDTPEKMLENAEALYQAGAKACLVNFIFGGLDALKDLAERYGDKMFIMGHYAGVGVMNGHSAGISNAVMLGLLPRLAGAHSVMTMASLSGSPASLFDFQKTVQAQRLPLGEIAPLVTAVGGGITPISQEMYQKELGIDTIIGIGGAIQGHPMGATAGARAAMAAVEATARQIPLQEASLTCESLAVALKLWGKQP